MSVYKYMSSEGGLRFLRSWQLRITPPADFNDPFELRAPAGRVFTEAYVNTAFEEAVPKMIVKDLTQQLAPAFGAVLSDSEINDVVTCLLPSNDTALQKRVLVTIVPRVPVLAGGRFLALQTALRAQWPKMMEDASQLASVALPTVNTIVQKSLLEAPLMLGVLCLSRNANQPLMWAHYAESHRGLMIEFDEAHPTFNRKRSAADDFGYFRPVLYSKVRPELSMHTFDGDNAFEVFALTKSEHWSYEEESRFLWPLRGADRAVDAPNGQIGLISCPPSSVLSVTLGCKASSETLEGVNEALKSQADGNRILVRQARLDDVAFHLNYFLV